MLDYRLESFICVCKHLSYTKAADELNITQPAVSQHIKFLEENYQIKLFLYHKKRLQITEEGILLLNAATTMKHDEIYLKEKLTNFKDKNEHIIFGVTLTVGEYIVAEHICNYLKKYPNSNIKMVYGNTQDLLSKINNGEIDFALIEGYFTKTEFDHLLYTKEKYIGVCGSKYKFKNKVHNFEDLINEKLILREKGSGTRDIIEKYAEEKNIILNDFKNTTEIGNINTIKQLVKEDIGITFLYEAAVMQELQDKSIRKIDLEDFNIIHDITFIWRKGSIFKDYYHHIFNELKK